MSEKSRDFWKIWVPIAINTSILFVNSWIGLKIKESVKDEMEKYVSQVQFIDYQKAHKEWADEVLSRISGQMADLKVESGTTRRITEDNNNIIRELRGEIRARFGVKVTLDQDGFAKKDL